MLEAVQTAKITMREELLKLRAQIDNSLSALDALPIFMDLPSAAGAAATTVTGIIANAKPETIAPKKVSLKGRTQAEATVLAAAHINQPAFEFNDILTQLNTMGFKVLDTSLRSAFKTLVKRDQLNVVPGTENQRPLKYKLTDRGKELAQTLR